MRLSTRRYRKSLVKNVVPMPRGQTYHLRPGNDYLGGRKGRYNWDTTTSLCQVLAYLNDHREPHLSPYNTLEGKLQTSPHRIFRANRKKENMSLVTSRVLPDRVSKTCHRLQSSPRQNEPLVH
jgi:hypothetical protein